MPSKVLQSINKVMENIGLVDGEEDENEVIDDTEVDNYDNEEEEDNEKMNKKNNKIVSIKTNSQARVLLKKPQEIQDVMDVIDSVKSRRIVIMNIVGVESMLAQRMVDCVVGACYALNSSFQEIDKCIYIVAPDNVEVSSEFKQEVNNENFFSL